MDFKNITKKTARAGVAALLSSALVISSGFPSGINIREASAAPWDGYREPENLSASFELMDFNKFGGIMSAGGVPSRKNAKNGNIYSAQWTNHLANGDFWIKTFPGGVPSDWVAYNTLELQIYSAKATGATIMPVVYSPDTAASTGNYFSGFNFKVDWEGWKTIKLDLSKASATRQANWSNITQFRLVSNGNWGIVGNPETDLYIASIKLKGTPVSYEFTTGFYNEDKINQAIAYMAGSVAVHSDGVNAVTAEGQKALGYDIDYINKRVMVPVKLFADYLGATAIDNGSEWSVTLGDKTVSADSSAYAKDSVTYVDGEKVAKELGLSAFTDGKLLVMGTKETYDALKRPENLGVNEYNEIVAQKTFNTDVNSEDYTAEDMEEVLQKWEETLVGSEALNDLNDADIKSTISTISSGAKAAWSKLIKGNPADEVFEGTVSNASDVMTSDYGRVLSMAKGYACAGSEYYHDEALLEDIIYALDWLCANRYSIEGRAKWKFTGFDNWYAWDIGTPTNLVPTLILLRDKLTKDQINKYLDYYTVKMPMPKLTGGNYTAEAKCVIGSALLRGDVKKVLQVQADFQKMYLFVDDNERITESQLRDDERKKITPMKGAGYFTDGSYILHTLHAMNGTYGPAHYGALVFFEELFGGTKFQFNTPLRENLVDIFDNGVDAMLFGTTMYTHVLGRGYPFNNANSGISLLTQMFTVADNFDPDVRDRIYSSIKTAYYSGMNNQAQFVSSLGIDQKKRFLEVMNDDSIPLITNKKQSKIFYNIDKVAHERDDWALGVSMSSARIFNYECINNNNPTGWYLGDGRTEYYLKGNQMNANGGYWATIDPYRLPGTTVDTQERKQATIAQGNEYLSSKHFVGGVSLNNEYGAAAMHLESYHNEADFPAGYANSSYGGPAPAHKNDLVAQKTYYMLDDGVICLGTGVNAKDNNNAEVLTIVENSLAQKTVDLSDNPVVNEPYVIKSAVASVTPEAANIAPNTIDSDYSTKWAAELDGEIVWDIGEVKPLGFIALSLQNGSKRQQKMVLQVSKDGNNWETVFDGASSGKIENDECFDLQDKEGRYVKYINKGNTAGSTWVSITECKLYPRNTDGTIGFTEPEIYGAEKLTVDGAEFPLLKDEADLSNAKWAHLENKCGYYFPAENTDNRGQLKARWTRGSSSFFELWFTHGVNPTDGRYAYVLLPGATVDETKAFAEGGAVSILSNTNKVQAAKDNRTNVTYYTFWEKGAFGDVTVDQPCMIVTQETETGLKVAISDPTQKLTSLNVKIEGSFNAIDLDEKATATSAGGNTTIKCDMAGSVGRSFNCVFAK